MENIDLLMVKTITFIEVILFLQFLFGFSAVIQVHQQIVFDFAVVPQVTDNEKNKPQKFD